MGLLQRSSSARRLQMLLLCAAVVWASLLSSALAFSAADYASALDKSILYFDLQRSGTLPPWQRISWRGNSAVNDGRTSNVDLSGGYYDAGDNVKFGLPMAFTVTLLSWGVVEFGDSMSKAGQLGHALNAIRWGTDYLLKAHTGPNELWVQVGEPNSDHQCWERPEDMDTPRTAYKVNAANPGSDVAGETAAALAAASMAFRTADGAYAGRLIASAKQVFTFANSYRGKYSDHLSGAVCPFYCSYSGFQDELVWGATWLYKATRDNGYAQYLIANGGNLGGTTQSPVALDWDNKYVGAQVLLTQEVLSGNPGFQGYKDRADNYICSVLPRTISPSSQTSYTPGGMLFHSGQSNMQYVTTATFLLTTYAKYLSASRQTVNCGGRHVTSAQLFSVAQRQVDYILGSNPKGMSYMIGFGRNPTRVHHRAASLPSMGAHPQKIQCQQGFTWFNSGNPNPNQATGALVGGPDQSDNIQDVRSNYDQMEPATYINAPIVAVLAALATGQTFN